MRPSPINEDWASRPMHSFPESVFRNNFTEMFHQMSSTQCQEGNSKPRCGEYQMNAVECLEAYGAKRGRRYCRPYLEDYMECLHSYKQITRVNEMAKERMRQLMRGERSLSNYHDKVKPPRDAWQMGPFHP